MPPSPYSLTLPWGSEVGSDRSDSWHELLPVQVQSAPSFAPSSSCGSFGPTAFEVIQQLLFDRKKLQEQIQALDRRVSVLEQTGLPKPKEIQLEHELEHELEHDRWLHFWATYENLPHPRPYTVDKPSVYCWEESFLQEGQDATMSLNNSTMSKKLPISWRLRLRCCTISCRNMYLGLPMTGGKPWKEIHTARWSKSNNASGWKMPLCPECSQKGQ